MFDKKHLSLMLFISLSVAANAASNKDVINYLHDLSASRGNKAESIIVTSRKPVASLQGWEMVTLSFRTKGVKGEIMSVSDALFTNGDYITDNFISLKKRAGLKELMSKVPNSSFYNSEHLISGELNAKHKVVVFSDPQCPFCREFMETVRSYSEKNPKTLAVFLYDFPIVSIHPTSPLLIKSMIFLRTKGIDASKLFYSYEFKEKNEARALAEVNTLLRKNKIKIAITSADIQNHLVSKIYKENLRLANELMISGTPAVYTDGEVDHYQQNLKKIIE